MKSQRFPQKCKRCANDWNSYIPEPKYCPACKSPLWNKDRVRGVPKAEQQVAADVVERLVNLDVTPKEPDKFYGEAHPSYADLVRQAKERLKR